MTADHWDARYRDRPSLWSGNPNGGLVTEVTGTVPGRVLDVGCGEGADAIWLAGRGWSVTRDRDHASATADLHIRDVVLRAVRTA